MCVCTSELNIYELTFFFKKTTLKKTKAKTILKWSLPFARRCYCNIIK